MENQKLIKSGVEHPSPHRTGTFGDLIQFQTTGIYALRCGGSIISVPQDWAAHQTSGIETKVGDH